MLFAANHNAVRGDSMVLAKATPRAWRRQLSFAAAAEITFDNRLTGIVAAAKYPNMSWSVTRTRRCGGIAATWSRAHASSSCSARASSPPRRA